MPVSAIPEHRRCRFVAALDKVDGMRTVPGLFEGAVTGMAEGYGRKAEKSAATLPNSRVQEGGPAVSQPVEPC